MLTEITYLNHHLPIRLDWWKKVARCFNIADENSPELTKCLTEFCHKNDIDGEGIMTSELRQLLCQKFENLRIKLIGTHLEPRLLIKTDSEETMFDACKNIVTNLDGCAFDTPYVPQLLAIRGAEFRNNGIWQTDSAKRFVSQPYGNRDHFSSAKSNYFDSIFVLFWQDTTKHAQVFRGTVNPNNIWADGTAHLLDGQYTYKLGKHRTYSRPHIDAVATASQSWPTEWIYENDNEHIRYIALEGVSPVNVIRSTGNSLDISDEDIAQAELKISKFKPTFVNTERIKINIHTCPYDQTSSLGCQNIDPAQYAQFIQILLDLQIAAQGKNDFAFETWYFLTDASKIAL